MGISSLANRRHHDSRAGKAAAISNVGICKIGVITEPQRVNLDDRRHHDCRAGKGAAISSVEVPAIGVIAAVYGSHFLAAEFFAEGEVFDHQGRHGNTPKGSVGVSMSLRSQVVMHRVCQPHRMSYENNHKYLKNRQYLYTS